MTTAKPVVVDGTIYVPGKVPDSDMIAWLDADEYWEMTHPCS